MGALLSVLAVARLMQDTEAGRTTSWQSGRGARGREATLFLARARQIKQSDDNSGKRRRIESDPRERRRRRRARRKARCTARQTEWDYKCQLGVRGRGRGAGVAAFPCGVFKQILGG